MSFILLANFLNYNKSLFFIKKCYCEKNIWHLHQQQQQAGAGQACQSLVLFLSSIFFLNFDKLPQRLFPQDENFPRSVFSLNLEERERERERERLWSPEGRGREGEEAEGKEGITTGTCCVRRLSCAILIAPRIIR